MITIQKLPSLEPEMRGALRSHIIRKRQRLKQELEQDAIEKRMKKEREQKRIQDAMTLDQIKEQLSTLEKRLETLRGEKHDLFVQLKQVLNEGSSKRKQTSETNTANNEPSQPDEPAKRPKIEDNESTQAQPQTSDQTTSSTVLTPTTTTAITTAATLTAPPPAAISTTTTLSHGKTIKTTTSHNETITSKPVPMTYESRVSELNLSKKPTSHPQQNLQPPQHLSAPLQLANLRSQQFPPPTSSYNSGPALITNTPNQHSTEMRFALPPATHNPGNSFFSHSDQHQEMINFSRRDSLQTTSSKNSMSAQQLAAMQAHFRSSFPGPSLPSQIPHELLMTGSLDPSIQRFGLPPQGIHGRLPFTSIHSDAPISLAQTSQQVDANKLSNAFSNGPRSGHTGPIDINGYLRDERLLALKKGLSGHGTPYHPSQMLVDNSLQPSLAHLSFLNQAALSANIDPSTSIGQSMLLLGPSNLQSQMNYNQRKMPPDQSVPRSGVDFLMGQLRPAGMLIPNLGSIYASQQAGTQMTAPTSIFGSNGQIDLDHLNSMYQQPLPHQMNNSMTNFNNSMTKQQQQQQQQQLHLDQQHLQNFHQQEQASRLFASQNSANYHRKPTPKNPYR